MKYKGYNIYLTEAKNHYFTIDDDGVPVDEVKQEIGFQTIPGFDGPWYSVVGDDEFLLQSFDSVEECKQYIDEECE